MDPCSLTVQVALFLGVMGIIVMMERRWRTQLVQFEKFHQTLSACLVSLQAIHASTETGMSKVAEALAQLRAAIEIATIVHPNRRTNCPMKLPTQSRKQSSVLNTLCFIRRHKTPQVRLLPQSFRTLHSPLPKNFWRKLNAASRPLWTRSCRQPTGSQASR